ncbi:hypothetical protein CI102_14005 [Trichoderma harzianum]|nr:hypothetical protein CI102_14005 [Trichoderma harzianum]
MSSDARARSMVESNSHPCQVLVRGGEATHRKADNARIHNFGGTPEWLQVHGIDYIDWPPHSPDLNPIEHVWKALKENLFYLFPYLYDSKDNT